MTVYDGFSWADLTEAELAEAPPVVRDLINRMHRQAERTTTTLVLTRPDLTCEQAESECMASLSQWTTTHVSEDEGWQLFMFMALAELLRDHTNGAL